MKTTCEQEKLSNIFGMLSRVTPRRATMPILQSVLVDAEDDGNIRFVATDLETAMSVRVNGNVQESGRSAVPVNLFHDLVRTFNQNEVTIELPPGAGVMRVVSGKSKANVNCLPVNEFPPLPDPDGDVTIGLPAEELHRALSRSVFAAATEDSRPILTGVQIKLSDLGYEMHATDGFQVAIAAGDTVIEGLSDLLSVVPASVLTELTRVLSGCNGNVAINVQEGRVHFSFDKEGMAIVITGQILHGTFPKLADLIPQSGFNVKCEAKVDDLLTAVRRGARFAAYNNSQAIRLAVVRGEQQRGVMVVSAGLGETARTETNIDVTTLDMQNDEFQIAFNRAFLQKILEEVSQSKEDKLAIEFVSSTDPGIFKVASGNNQVLYMVMPVVSNATETSVDTE